MEEQQKRALSSLIGQARTQDSVNGYWVGFFEGVQKTIDIAREEILKNG